MEPAQTASAVNPKMTGHSDEQLEDRKRLAKADCFKFATSFYTAMPREIRDRVYSYLFLPDLNIPLKLYKAEQELAMPIVFTEMPHWQSHDFVGPEFAREYTELFYEKTKLHFDPVEAPGIFPITNLLQHDPFGNGILPSDFVRSCTIDFSESKADYTKEVDSGSLKAQINSLLTLKKHPARRITFRIDLGNLDHEHYLYDTMFKHLLVLGPLLYSFKDQGLDFEVFLSTDLWEPTEEWRDITFLWDMESTELFYKLHAWAAIYGM
jgi:hypothetical protein